MKYLLLGNGWIAGMLKNYLGDNAFISKSYFGYDLTQEDIKLITQYDVVINCVAKTQIDWCEKNKYETLLNNTILARNIAYHAKVNNIKNVFISSACIFESKDMDDEKNEWSKPNPACFYAETKVLAEKLIEEIDENALIARFRLPISEVPHPRNTLNKLLKYPFISDNQESITIIEDMIPQLVGLIDIGARGIFHFINEGTISPAEIANMLGHTFTKVTKQEQDERLMKEGRAKRVTTYAISTKISMLPNIRKRMIEVIKKYRNGTNTTS